VSAATAGLVVALPEECRSLTRRRVGRGDCLRLGPTQLVCVAGAGGENAVRAAHRLVDAGAAGLISWGCAAGLAPALRAGDLCLPIETVDVRGSHRPVSEAWHWRAETALQAAVGLHSGPLLTADRIAATPAAKRSLAAEFSAIAADMESAGVAAVALERGVPFLVVRAIADPADMALPSAVLRAADADGNVRRLALLGHVLLHPSDCSDLLKLASHFRAALQTLTRAADALGPDLQLA